MDREDCEELTRLIKHDPHSVFRRFRGDPQRMSDSMRQTTIWEPYAGKLAAGSTAAAGTPPQLNPFAPEFQPTDGPACADIQQLRSAADSLNAPFAIEEVEAALSRLNNNRAPGASGQPAEMLRYAVLMDEDGNEQHVLLPALTDIFNSALQSGHVPDTWNIIYTPHNILLVDSSGVMQQISKTDIAKATAAATSAEQRQLAAMDPRIAPSSGAKLCTYFAWFAPPEWSSGQRFWQLSLSAPQQRALMRLLLGSHQLLIELGRHQKPPQPRHLRTCTACAAGVVGDEKHLLMECDATAGVRQQFSDLFAQPNVAMHQLVWHNNRRRVAAFILQCLAAVNLISSSSASDD